MAVMFKTLLFFRLWQGGYAGCEEEGEDGEECEEGEEGEEAGGANAKIV